MEENLRNNNIITKKITIKNNVRIIDSGEKKFVIKRKDKDIEYMWNGNPKYWANRNPILFPHVSAPSSKVLNFKDWQKVVTHNPDGEYGNQHHKMVSQSVTSLMNNKNNLYYFGNYYSKKNIFKYKSQLSIIDEEILYKKLKLIGLYSSQNFIQTSFEHMYEHEQWQSYNEWMSENHEKNE